MTTQKSDNENGNKKIRSTTNERMKKKATARTNNKTKKYTNTAPHGFPVSLHQRLEPKPPPPHLMMTPSPTHTRTPSLARRTPSPRTVLA
jgi:hypothetical protein